MAALAGAAPEPRPVPRLGQSCLRVHDSLHGHVTATRHNPAIRAFHIRLCRRGKPRKATLIAAMRKLLLILNTVPPGPDPLATQLRAHGWRGLRCSWTSVT